MKVGIGLPNPIPGTPGRALVEWARRAEDAGFSTLATIDRVAYPSYESLIALAAAAGATSRIGLLTNVLLGPTRDPVLLAKEAASLDQLSGGRFTLGVGVGGRRDDFDVVGRRFETRGRDWDAALEVMHAIWRGEPAPGTDREVAPRPVNGSSVPIMIGGNAPQNDARLVRWGAGWSAGGAPPEHVAPAVERFRRVWHEAGCDGEPRIIALAYFALGPDSLAGARAYLGDYYGGWGEGMAMGVPRTREAILERQEAFRAIGVDELIWDPTIGSIEQLDLLADAVR